MPGKVVEAANDTLKELFIFTSSQTVEELRMAHESRAPRPISHWNFLAERIAYREIERELSGDEFNRFIEGYVALMRGAGWAILVNDE